MADGWRRILRGGGKPRLGDPPAVTHSAYADAPDPEPEPVPRLDLWLASAATVLAAVAAFLLPDGSLVRLLVTAPAWLFLPGYLMLQALLVPVRPPALRVVHAVAAIGLSIPMVGLLALATVVLPGGLSERSIVAVVTFVCLALAVVAGMRRIARPNVDDEPDEPVVRRVRPVPPQVVQPRRAASRAAAPATRSAAPAGPPARPSRR